MLFGKQERRVKRILIVEDEPLVAFDNEVMVGNCGYDVVATVDRVRDALAVIEREDKAIDLILTDISLAGERDGLALAREVKPMNIPVLFATADPPDGCEGFALGVLIKPYNERRLKAALKAAEQWLSGKKVRAPDGVILYPQPAAA